MLAWELHMNEDLSPLFGEVLEKTTSTSTPLREPFVFEDSIIKNKEVRVLKDTKGTIRLLYSFIDRETLVITTNESTFSEVLTRLTSQRI